ncbi:MAG: hypothetical protein AB7H92_14695 [Microbacteriaceae bacterium]
MRRLVITVAIVALVGAIGMRGRGSSRSSDAAGAPAPSPAPAVAQGSSAAGPRGEQHGVPVGWSHDGTGARAAAITAVGLTGEIARAGFITRADMIDVLASDSFAPTLARASAAQLHEVFGDLTAEGTAVSSILFRELPLTAEVLHVDTASARVAVWSVLVTGVADQGAARQLWRTVTVELVWERDDWQVDGWTAAAGPTPALATNAPLAAVDELIRVTGWPSAGGAG